MAAHVRHGGAPWLPCAHPCSPRSLPPSRVATSDILSRFGAVLLDMNGTLMFGGDRFGPDQHYAATYRSLGGSRLAPEVVQAADRKSTRLNSSHQIISYAVFCLKKKKKSI